MTDQPQLELEFALVAGPDGHDLPDEAGLRDLALAVLRAEAAQGDWDITVALVSDAELQSLHARFMNIDEPTDIMTFSFDDGLPGGELAISVDHARNRAGEWGNSPAQEIEFLVAHGILHLLGWRDESEEQRAAMLSRQAVLVERWREGSSR
ncbi:MAG: rRNA maturation RNase YbeY [Thermomicrobiales bacterium]|nr:rRNA maturation RNase YbeY [Thermomicrobiales bacterium]